MTSYLSKSEEESAKKIVQKLMTNTLGQEMTLEGRSGKIKFMDTKLYEAFEGKPLPPSPHTIKIQLKIFIELSYFSRCSFDKVRFRTF